MTFQKGNILSDEWRKQHSERMMGEGNSFYGKHHTEETKKIISESRLGDKNPNFRKPISEEQKQKISESISREKHFFWKGGKKRHEGYILVLKPEHPLANCQGYIAEHRLMMEEFLGRFLLADEVVHHINGIKDDNRIENLLLFKNQNDHVGDHNKITKKKTA